MEQKETNIVPAIEAAKLAADIAVGYGTTKIMDNLIKDIIPNNLRWPARLCIGLTNTILTSMLVDAEWNHLSKKAKAVKKAIDILNNELEKQKNSEEEPEEDTTETSEGE